MISEAVGKIVGMAMAYGVSALGLFLAYVNYRRRILRAEKVMTATAWVVVALTVLAVVGGVWVVAQLAELPPEGAVPEKAEEFAPVVAEPEAPAPAIPVPEPAEEPSRWPWVGIAVPALIFLFATVVTVALHRHFSRSGVSH